MISTRNIVTSLSSVPYNWIFEHYLNLPMRLDGSDVKIKSVFNPNEKEPSMCIYFDKRRKKYRFKDFSSGKEGDPLELVMCIFDLKNRASCSEKIIEDYSEWLKTNEPYKSDGSLNNLDSKYVLDGFKVRKWEKQDLDYWNSFAIPVKTLNHFRVAPLEIVVLVRENGRGKKILRDECMYGFFKVDGTLYKIYKPLDSRNKFFRNKSWIHGWEQLTFKKPHLGIFASMKDMLSFRALGFEDVDTLAPESENVFIPERLILGLKERYRTVFTFLDPDPAGVKAMLQYEEKYQLPPCILKLEKDLAEAVRIHRVRTVQEHVYPLLTKILTGTSKYFEDETFSD